MTPRTDVRTDVRTYRAPEETFTLLEPFCIAYIVLASRFLSDQASRYSPCKWRWLRARIETYRAIIPLSLFLPSILYIKVFLFERKKEYEEYRARNVRIYESKELKIHTNYLRVASSGRELANFAVALTCNCRTWAWSSDSRSCWGSRPRRRVSSWGCHRPPWGVPWSACIPGATTILAPSRSTLADNLCIPSAAAAVDDDAGAAWSPRSGLSCAGIRRC